MSAPAQTKIFGIRLGVNPKILVGVLIGFAIIIFWYNMRSDDDTAPSTPAVHHEAAAPAPAVRPKAAIVSRRRPSADDGALRLRPIDATRGDVDPTLRLDLLARLQNVEPAVPGRSLFDIGAAPLSAADQKILSHPPTVPKRLPAPSPSPAGPSVATEQPLNIPLKYYGFVKSGEKSQGNEGLFLDGDTVVVGAEGELVMKRYLVVSLTPSSARLEDTQLKKGQTLPVVPAATP